MRTIQDLSGAAQVVLNCVKRCGVSEGAGAIVRGRGGGLSGLPRSVEAASVVVSVDVDGLAHLEEARAQAHAHPVF